MARPPTRGYLLPALLAACAAPQPSGSAMLAARVRALVGEAIAARVFPGCQIVVVAGSTTLLDGAWGRETYEPSSPAVTRTTRYDLASLTKIVAATGLAMALHAQGKLDLDAPVQRLLPELAAGEIRGAGQTAMTLRHLLAHCSGLPAHAPYWRTARSPDEMRHLVLTTRPQAAPTQQARYSDLGMIVLGFCLERLGEQPLDLMVNEHVVRRLGLGSTRYGPLPADVPVAPTEVVAERGGTLRGRVHDENAEALGGVSAHAGLFATAGDVARFARAVRDGAPPFAPRTIALFTRRADLVAASSRALGFDTWHEGSSAGDRLSPSAYGHTGFTGTSLWIDPERQLIVVCLSNRVHPTRQNDRIQAFRRRLHDVVVECLGQEPDLPPEPQRTSTRYHGSRVRGAMAGVTSVSPDR